jgi:glycosyltransferase involved in cell wall biosynthesis
MEAKPFFTIITASLNNGATILNTLESVKRQTLQDLEHIVIDGGSTDGTVSILKKQGGDYNLSWVSEKDNGIADALNKAIKKASGAYVVVIQADDRLIDDDTLEKVYPVLKDEVYDIHSFPVITHHPVRGNRCRKPIRILWWNHFKFIFPHQGCFVHRRVFERIGGFRERFSINMDYDFFYRALAARRTVCFGHFPVALMGGEGIGTNFAFASKRLKEERLVQVLNERNPFWRFAQLLFRTLYVPYRSLVALKYR